MTEIESVVIKIYLQQSHIFGRLLIALIVRPDSAWVLATINVWPGLEMKLNFTKLYNHHTVQLELSDFY